ncbi:MAG: hypothetical protein RSB82_04865 [Victivallaceae bacterium]
MKLTGTIRIVAQVIGVFGGLFFALIGYNILPTIFYYSGISLGTYIYLFSIVWCGLWFVFGFWILYGLVGLVYRLIKKIMDNG